MVFVVIIYTKTIIFYQNKQWSTRQECNVCTDKYVQCLSLGCYSINVQIHYISRINWCMCGVSVVEGIVQQGSKLANGKTEFLPLACDLFMHHQRKNCVDLYAVSPVVQMFCSTPYTYNRAVAVPVIQHNYTHT